MVDNNIHLKSNGSRIIGIEHDKIEHWIAHWTREITGPVNDLAVGKVQQHSQCLCLFSAIHQPSHYPACVQRTLEPFTHLEKAPRGTANHILRREAR